MIYGIGLDVVDMSRIAEAVGKSDKFVSRVLTREELQVYETLSDKRKLEFVSGRFAAKEAFSKAYGTGIGVVGFQDIKVLPNEKNKPILTCAQFEGRSFVSISHTDALAIAQVVLEVD